MKTYFPNLNTLRFLAVTMVMIFHIELFKKFYDLPNLFHLPFFQIVGKLSVVLFFVLSGLLITSLLLNEIEKHQKINVKNFYLRRIFRIWPLYFLILILGFFVIPHFPTWADIPNPAFKPVGENFWEKLLLYIFILPNLAVAYFGEITGTSQSWSLGTEEQFYLFWPLQICFFRKKVILAMVGLLIFYWIVKLGFAKAGSVDPRFNIRISAVSYEYFEKVFLRTKNKFAQCMKMDLHLMTPNYQEKVSLQALLLCGLNS